MAQHLQLERQAGRLQLSTQEPLSTWWRMEVPHPLAIRGQRNEKQLFAHYVSTTNEFVGQLSDAYDVRLAHERAQERHDPYLAPHGFFRRLKHGENRHALEFLEKFGPLRLTPGQREATEQVVVGLDQFWRLHLRFCLVCDLWESIEDHQQLSDAWEWVHRNHAVASTSEDQPLGSFIMTGRYGNPTVGYSGFPWDRAGSPFEEWHRSASLSELRESALWLIHSELDLHMHGRTLCWERGWEPSQTRFRPMVRVDSLWLLIWEFFGLDTAGMFWRRCPHCQRIFYARRKDQFYCTPRQQALASKRAFAARKRLEAKLKQKKTERRREDRLK